MTQDPRAVAIQRYELDAEIGSGMTPHNDGDWVAYDDHLNALTDARRQVWEEAAKMACSRCAVGVPRNEHWFHLICDATKYWLKAHAGQEG